MKHTLGPWPRGVLFAFIRTDAIRNLGEVMLKAWELAGVVGCKGMCMKGDVWACRCKHEKYKCKCVRMCMDAKNGSECVIECDWGGILMTTFRCDE